MCTGLPRRVTLKSRRPAISPQRRCGRSAPQSRLPTAIGHHGDQHVLPVPNRRSDAAMARRAGDAPLRARVAQRPSGSRASGPDSTTGPCCRGSTLPVRTPRSTRQRKAHYHVRSQVRHDGSPIRRRFEPTRNILGKEILLRPARAHIRSNWSRRVSVPMAAPAS